MRVNSPHVGLRPLVFRAAVCLLIGTITVYAQDKAIRLRNQPISTPPKSAPALQSWAVEAPASGLFLVQFIDRVQPAWREQLRAMRVELVRYVPDDAFIARFDSANREQVYRLPFVRWIGPYRPEHKLDSRLKTAERSKVRVLLAPSASAKDQAIVRRSLRTSGRESKLRFGNILKGEVTPAQLATLARSDAVLWIEPEPKPRLVDEISSKIVGGDDDEAGTRTVTQQLGFDGSGVKVAVADTGLNNGDAETMHPDLAGRVDKFLYYGSLTDAMDEHSHGTHVTGIIAGNAATGETDDNGFLYGLGVAPGAHIVVQRVFDAVGNDELPAAEVLTHDAVRAGAVIGSNSWGDDVQGRYDLSAAEFDGLVRDADAATPGDQPYILEFSAGNAGPGTQSMDSPAVGKNVIATGASENNRFDFFIYTDGQETMADFSSRGPCEDGRIKPDVVAPGTWIASLQSESATDENAWAAIDNYYQYEGGTSQAGPHASGAAAVFVQYYRAMHGNATPSPALVKAALINSAMDMDDESGTRPVPNNDEGWGRIDLTQIIGSPRRSEFIDQTNLLATGQTYEHRVVVAGSDEPLKITLAYTDVPGFPGAIPALVNDLDLEVEAPDGRVYRGNQFDEGESVPEAPSSDNINNVEAVHLSAPPQGEYIARVRARNVVEDARNDTAAVDQDFALVVSGDLPLPGVGVLFFDRSAYRAPDVIKVKLIDPDLAGQPSVNVSLTSSTETNGELLTLEATGALGIFTNSIVTVTGGAAADGRLQVANGNAIETTYQDASPSATRTATARADLVAPVLTNVTETNQFGKAIIRWTSDEPATSIVRYGTNGNLTFAATSSVLEETHAIELNNLLAGTNYQFLVISADEAGNAATNDNGGALFSFVAAPAKTVLLVDAYVQGADYDSIEIPVTEYTAALDQTGVSYDVWDIEQRGSPRAADLRPFRVVVWRLNDSFYDGQFISATEQVAIRSYLDGGGGFFLASMEIISRLLDNGGGSFVTNVLHVDEFIRKTDPLSECTTCDEDRGIPVALGVDTDPVTSGVDLTLDYGAYPVLELEPLGLPNIGPDVGDTFRPTADAAAILTDPLSQRSCGVRFPRSPQANSGRVVFLSFPLDAVPMNGTGQNNRPGLLRKVLSFLAPGADGAGTLTFDSGAYTLPSQVTIELGDSDLGGQGSAAVTVRTASGGSATSVTLSETPRRGIFRGFFNLVDATNAPAANQFPARNGDTVTAEYSDVSAGRVITAVAHVDTAQPVIRNVTVTADYESAEVSWDTSKPTDALVQFWDTTAGFPRNRTAYQNDLAETHTLTLPGLVPDRSYSFQVVSRDPAGNTTVDDNGGQFYRFSTLLPITVPWVDDLNNSGTNWTVLDADFSEGSWQLGVPNNGWETAAHSPPNAWGSNLNGDATSVVWSFLLSPAINLTGGNVATLRFWHSYDFSGDNFDGGELLLVVNNTTVTLESYGWLANLTDDSTKWTEAEFDLTPYLGHVIYLAWQHVFVSLDFAEPSSPPGWLVDDVSVTVTNVERGTLVITNNIAEAHFNLSGPISQTGQGWGLTLTNAPFGQYAVTFDPVPYYQTPPSQTNLVNSAMPVVFRGDYTFADTNVNGISDEWEQHFFTEVSTNRTQTTDTDGDGTPDYAEFIAGTDPNNMNSVLDLTPPTPQPNGSLKFEWLSVPGHAYRLAVSADLVNWVPLSDWLRATTATSSVVIVPPTSNASNFYRLEVRP
jgi:hypothetical protein